ncbi:hypothetical protein D3C71_1269160 [compost metagenome]
MVHHQAAQRGAEGDTHVERGDVQARRHVGRLRGEPLRLLDHIHLQPRHVAERHRAQGQHGQQHQPGVVGGEGEHQQHGRQQREDQLQRRDRAAAVGQAAAPQIAERHRHAVHQQHAAHRIGREAADVLQDRGQVGKGQEGAAITQRGDRIHQQQARLGQHRQLLAERGRFAALQVARHEQQAADQRDHAQRGHGQEGRAPAQVLADEGTQRHAGDQCHGQAGEHDRDRAGGLLLGHHRGGDDRADREEHAVCQAGKHAGHDQRAVAGRHPGNHVAQGEQHHQGHQQGLARHPAGERGQYRRAHRHAQGVQRDQQAGRGQGDAEVGGDGRDQPDDDEFGGADGVRTKRERQQGQGDATGHGRLPVGGEAAQSGRRTVAEKAAFTPITLALWSIMDARPRQAPHENHPRRNAGLHRGDRQRLDHRRC